MGPCLYDSSICCHIECTCGYLKCTSFELYKCDLNRCFVHAVFLAVHIFEAPLKCVRACVCDCSLLYFISITGY